jgi:hypothetical protein
LTLLNVAAPLVLAFLGRRARNDGLNPSSLATLLRGQKDSLAAAVPGPLANIGSYFATPVKAREVYTAPPAPEPSSSVWRWLLPVLAVLAAFAVLFPLFTRKDRGLDHAATLAAVEPARATQSAPVASRPTAIVYFDVDQSALPATGEAALSSVIAYLKMNSGATAVVSGYHDPSGDQAANEQLARNRADTVRSTLVAAGVEESRIEMVKPVVTQGGGTSEEARRVEVTVR